MKNTSTHDEALALLNDTDIAQAVTDDLDAAPILESHNKHNFSRQRIKHRAHNTQTSALLARHKMALSQKQFANLLDISVRTLQEWEQGRKQPSGAAMSLLKIALHRPDVLLAVLQDKAA